MDSSQMFCHGLPDQPGHDDLSRLELLRGLAPDEVALLRDTFHLRALARGRHLFSQGQPGEQVFLIVSGSVKIYGAGRDERAVMLALLGAGELVGASCLMEGDGYTVSAVARERIVLLVAERASFLAHLRESAGLSFNLSRMLARRLRLATDHARLLASHDAAGRVASLVLSLAREYGRPAEGGVQIALRMTQEDLASLAGITRVRANQVLGSFREQRWLALGESGRIVVLDPAALASRCAPAA